MYEYLLGVSVDAAEIFHREAELPRDCKPTMEQLLLRKWNATSSLQFKVYELQEKVAERDARLKRLSGLKGGK